MTWIPEANDFSQNIDFPTLAGSRPFDSLRTRFSSVTGLPFEFRDCSGVPIGSRRPRRGYCELMRSTEGGVKGCWQSTAASMPDGPGDVASYTCHGYHHFVTPVFVNSQKEGIIVLGPVRLNRSPGTHFADLAMELSLPIEAVSQKARRVPLTSRNRALMALKFFSSACNSLISQTAISRDNSMLQTKYRQTIRELSSLQAVTDSALSTLDLDEILHTLLYRFIQALHAEAGTIMLLDDKKENLSISATVGIPIGQLRQISLNLDSGFIGKVTTSKQVSTLHDTGTDNSIFVKYLAAAGMKSILGAPLVSRDRLVGAIVVGTFNKHRFQAKDSALMEILAQRASIPVENANLYVLERERVKKLQEIDDLRTEFISTVSHEFRTPMAIIKGFSQLLLRRGTSNLEKDVVKDYLTKIDMGITHLTGLVDGLLTLSRFEEGGESLRFKKEPVSIALTIAEIFETERLETEPRNIALESNIDADNQTVFTDGRALREILFNVVDNAIKYSFDRSKVRVSTLGDGSFVRIMVRDQGVGLKEDEIPLLFEKFIRFDNSRSMEAGGVGLGLFNAKRLVEALGGKIWVESKVGKGSVFNIAMPRYEEVSPPESDPSG